MAAERRPVVAPDLDEFAVVNPLLRATGVHSLLGVPLLAGKEMLGVLHVGTRSTRHFSSGDVALLERIAARVAHGVRVHTIAADRAATTALHRSLWPEELPDLPDLEFAARYVPAGDGKAGGD